MHAGQRMIFWPRPLLEGVVTISGMPVSIFNRSVSIIAFKTNAEPVSR